MSRVDSCLNALAQAIAAETVATDELTAGFVYGFISFVEKLASALVIIVVQTFIGQLETDIQVGMGYKYIVSYGMAALTLLAAIVALIHHYLMKRQQKVVDF